MNNSSHAADTQYGQIIQDRRTISIIDVLDNLFYFRWHFIVIFVSAISVAVCYAIISTPIYTADALIQVEEKKGTSLGALTQVANALGAQQSPVLGEIEILRSRSVIGRAVDNLRANIEVSVENRLPLIGGWLSRVLDKDGDGLVKPLWVGSNFSWGGEQLKISEFIVPNSLHGIPLTLKVGEGKTWELLDKDSHIIIAGIDDEKMYASLDGKVRLTIDSLKARSNTKFRIIVYSLQSRVDQILANLTVIEAKRQSNILKLTYQSSNPAYAATMLNAISDTYLQQNVSRRSEEAELSLQFLNTELPKLRIRLDSAERILNEFRSKTKTIDISSEIKELLSQATIIEKTQLELELKRKEYIERYDPAHPIMKALISQLIGLKAEGAQLTKRIGQLPSVQQDYIRLARDVEVNNQLYVSLLNNSQQLQIAKAGTTGNVAIVDRALAPEQPTRPKKALIVAIGGLIGLIAGFAVCQILALISKIVRDPKKLEQETNLPTLAILPLDMDQLEHIDHSDSSIFLLAKEEPGASSIEALRSLRTSLLFKLSEKSRSKVVLITSALPSQGKSFIAVNLSYLFAAMGKKVLLIEADIRMASLQRYLNFDQSRDGLSTILKDQVPIDDVILKDIYKNMDFLPSGPTVRNPGDLLATDAMSSLVNILAESYDLVIIDSPPLLPVHDARALGKCADVTLFVVRQDGVSLTEIHDAIDLFGKSGNKIDGLIFNGFVPSRMRYGYGYGYGYGYSKYGKFQRYQKRYGTYGKYGKYGD